MRSSLGGSQDTKKRGAWKRSSSARLANSRCAISGSCMQQQTTTSTQPCKDHATTLSKPSTSGPTSKFPQPVCFVSLHLSHDPKQSLMSSKVTKPTMSWGRNGQPMTTTGKCTYDEICYAPTSDDQEWWSHKTTESEEADIHNLSPSNQLLVWQPLLPSESCPILQTSS